MSDHGDDEDGATPTVSIGQSTEEELEREYADYYDYYYSGGKL